MSNNYTYLSEHDLPGLISDQAKHVFTVVGAVVLADLFCVFGIGANILNIIVFAKQGTVDTVNISLLSLAIGDLGALTTQLWLNICLNPWFEESDIPFISSEIQSQSAGFPNRYFTKVTGWVTAFIMFERCLCIALPLKVKSIITRKLAIVFNVTLFVLLGMTLFPTFYTSYYDWKFVPKRNRTLIGIFYTENRKEVLEISLIITEFLVTFSSFTIVTVCTLVIVIKLIKKAKWRSSASGASIVSGDNMSGKDRSVARMVVVIAAIYIISFTPSTALLTTRAFVPELNFIGRYANLNRVIAVIGMFSEAVASSINIFVYYNMSSKYRKTFDESLCRRKQ
ncbi:violet-sensitive opsin-like [Aplysia californica]|uniref:Violet-sensitive opsin-like n=1 Tax=Aplysia californica TaxID=6500 RepID=A0ABM0JDR7_APLCA|nr:violet-sensitive opsin-like [Aplysia californica]